VWRREQRATKRNEKTTKNEEIAMREERQKNTQNMGFLTLQWQNIAAFTTKKLVPSLLHPYTFFVHYKRKI
jgi:hypothetical protein